MPWNSLTDLSDGDLVTETHMDNIRENIEWLGALTSRGTALSGVSEGSEISSDLFGKMNAWGSSSTTSTDWVSVNSLTFTTASLGFTPDAFLCFATFSLTNSNGTHLSSARIYLTAGQGTPTTAEVGVGQGGNTPASGAFNIINALSGTSWTISLQYKVNNSNTTATIGNRHLLVIPFRGIGA